jgi:hypothetical protein
MEKIKYILKQVRKYHYMPWDSDELEKCIDILRDLPRHELLLLNRNKWVSDDSMLKAELIKILYADEITKREERIVDMDTDELINLFLNKTDGYVNLAREELKRRYQENLGNNRAKICLAFAQSSQKDFKWIETQMKKELYC